MNNGRRGLATRGTLYRIGTIIFCVVGLAAACCCAGCVTTRSRLDPALRWQSAEKQRQSVMLSVEKIRQLRNDYEAVSAIAQSGDLRGRAFLRLAEIDSALGDYETARHNVLESLRAGLAPENQRIALLMLGDLLERHLDKKTEAETVYWQLIQEHPGTQEAQLAELRLEVMGHGR